MDFSLERGEPIWQSPVTPVRIGKKTLKLTYVNTCVREFGENWRHLDHIEYKRKDDMIVGVAAGRKLIELLKEREYPQRFDPTPDDHTIEWFIGRNMLLLSKEIEGL